jgi:hypothetical protein
VLDDGALEQVTSRSTQKGWLALAIMAGAILLAAFNPLLVGEIMLGSALLVVLAQVLTMDQVILGPRDEQERRGSIGCQRASEFLSADGAVGIVSRSFLDHHTDDTDHARSGGRGYPRAYRNPDRTASGTEPAQSGDGGCIGDLNGLHDAIGASREYIGYGAGWLSLSRLSASGAAAYRVIVGVVMILLPVFWPLTTK